MAVQMEPQVSRPSILHMIHDSGRVQGMLHALDAIARNDMMKENHLRECCD